jgi:hypothetical protein
MKALKLMLVLVFLIVGLFNRHHTKHHQDVPVRVSTSKPAVNQEILQNAERLTETLRRCKQTAQTNKETK